MTNTKNKMNEFSVALGLFDYINPIFYAITAITIFINMIGTMKQPLLIIFALGAILSLIFGLSIPTVKLLVGLGKFPFKMPVNLVFYVNCGILLSGLSLFAYVFDVSVSIVLAIILCVLLVLGLIYYKTKKFNTVAVLIGAVGYILIYSTLISLAIKTNVTISCILYIFAICLFVFLCCVGIFANLKNPKVHWIIEICNVICQGSVAVSTLLLFK